MSPLAAIAMPPGVSSHAEMVGVSAPVLAPVFAPITSATLAASRSMNVLAPMPTIMTTKMNALRRP